MNALRAAFALAVIVTIPLTAKIASGGTANVESGSTPSPQQTHVTSREVSHHVDLQYLVFVPQDYEKSTSRWPLILYLHGGSLRGEDILKMKRWGLTEKVETDPHFPFIVVSPQCHPGEIWTDVDALGAVLDDVAATYELIPTGFM